MGTLISKVSDTVSDLCCAPMSRVAVLEERVSDLEAIQRHSVSLGLCCAGPARTSIR